MSVRITGMNSGLDTESIIRELVSGASKKKDKTVKAQTKLEWKQEAWKGLNKKIKSFQSTVSSLRFSDAFRKKITTISNSNLATIVTGDNAVNGSQTLVVKQLAKSGYLTGGKLSNNKSVKGSTTLSQLTKGSDMAIAAGEKASFDIKVGNKKTTIELSGSSTIDDVVNKLKSAGVTASFDTANQRFFVSAGKSGDAGDFSFSANNVNGLKALSGLGLLTESDITASAAGKSELAGMYNALSGTIDTNAAAAYITARGDSYAASMQKNLASADTVATFFEAIDNLKAEWDADPSKQSYEAAVTKYTNKEGLATAKQTLESNQQKLAEQTEYLNLLRAKENAAAAGEELSDVEKNRLTELQGLHGDKTIGELESETNALSESIAQDRADITSAENAWKSYDSLQAAIGKQEDAIRAAVKDAKNLNDYYANVHRDELDAISGNTLQEKLDSVKASIMGARATDQDVTALEKQQALLEKMVANEEILNLDGVRNSSEYSSLTYDPADAIYAKAEKDITDQARTAHEIVNNSEHYLGGASESAVRIAGQNAIIELNGAEFTSTTNTFSINGLTITAKALSNVDTRDADGNPLTYEEAQITTQNDVDGLYKMIKDVLKQYNELIKEIDGLYNAESAKGYEPLTDEEKAAMTDTEVEKWEEKVKSAVLRRDSELGSVRNMLKESLMGSFKVGGKSYSLADFGIFTQGYFEAEEDERSMLHIDGDEDDEIGAGKKNILKQMLSSDPDTVGKFFNQMAGKLYDSMTYASRSLKGVRTYGNFYSDKTLAGQYDSYKKEIKKQEDKIGKMEDKYYKMFAAMESAMSKSNSTSSYLTNMFGM